MVRYCPRRTLAPPPKLDLQSPMCGSKKKSTDAIEPTRNPTRSSIDTPSANDIPASNNFSTTGGSTTSNAYSYSSSLSSSTSLIKASLPENPNIYELSEISAATGSFLKSRFSSSSWRCSLRGKDAIVFHRKLRRRVEAPEIQQRLATICRSHHSSLVKLLGASLSGSSIYLAYEFVHGASLADCLRSPRNPSFTVLSTWLSRTRIASDLAHALDYVHHCSGLRTSFVHNHITSSAVVVAGDGELSAKLCHFGTSELCGETEDGSDVAESPGDTRRPRRSRAVMVEGTRGYMAPEFQATGIPTQKGDVYAFGVVVLELLSGEEALKYLPEDRPGEGYRRVSVIKTARGALEAGELRRWIDRRVKDSYPVDVAETMVRVGLDCVEEDPHKRPDMGRVAVSMSKIYLESKNWAERIALPTGISVSLAPR